MKQANNVKEFIELLEADNDPISRMIEDCWLSPTEQAIDDDEEWQKQMGAEETLVKCAWCGKSTHAVSSFCNPEHKRLYIKFQEILAIEKKRWKTRQMMNGDKQ